MADQDQRNPQPKAIFALGSHLAGAAQALLDLWERAAARHAARGEAVS